MELKLDLISLKYPDPNPILMDLTGKTLKYEYIRIYNPYNITNGTWDIILKMYHSNIIIRVFEQGPAFIQAIRIINQAQKDA